MKNVKVLIGNYGSGKSELALNFAMQAAARGDRTELIDLDMVNTYFRLTERGKMVEQKEIRLVSPNYACSGIETLSLPAEVASAFVLEWDTVVFDVGGDDVGATALGRYHQDFVDLEPGSLEVLNVVNIRRPLSGTVGGNAGTFKTPDNRHDQQRKPCNGNKRRGAARRIQDAQGSLRQDGYPRGIYDRQKGSA